MLHSVFQEYVEEFAAEHSVMPCCRLGCPIESVTRESPSSQWEVTFVNAAGDRVVELYDFMVMCTGAFGKPVIPAEIEQGREEFGGVIVHSSEWDSPAMFEGKKVVVVGNGKGAVDAVVGALRGAECVHQVLALQYRNLFSKHFQPGSRERQTDDDENILMVIED